MAKHKQESVGGWEQDVRDLARAERELEIEHWVRIDIGYRDNGEWHPLYRFDFPRESEDRYRWIVRWRTARLQCGYPRFNVIRYYGRYDKRTGLKTDFNSCLGKLAASKAQVTKARRSRKEYMAAQKRNYPLFYDPAYDPDLKKFDDKLAAKENYCQRLHNSIRIAVENHKNQQNHVTNENTENPVAIQNHRTPERVQAGT